MPRYTTGSVLAVFCDEYYGARCSGASHKEAFAHGYDEAFFLGFPNGSNPDRVMQKVGVSMGMGIVATYRYGDKVFSILCPTGRG